MPTLALPSSGSLVTSDANISPTVISAISAGKLNVSASADGSRALIVSPVVKATPVTGVEVRQSVSPAVTQTDKLDVDSISAGASLVIDFGQIFYFLDLSSTALPVGDVLMIDPNGVPHDLAAWTITKTSTFDPPGLCPGRYTFINVSGGALSSHNIFVLHQGSRNLA